MRYINMAILLAYLLTYLLYLLLLVVKIDQCALYKFAYLYFLSHTKEVESAMTGITSHSFLIPLRVGG